MWLIKYRELDALLCNFRERGTQASFLLFVGVRSVVVAVSGERGAVHGLHVGVKNSAGGGSTIGAMSVYDRCMLEVLYHATHASVS